MVNRTKRIAINSISNLASLFTQLFIGIFLTPFLLHRLGADVFSIIPLVNSCTSFLVLAAGGVQGAVGRYATFHIVRMEYDQANLYINTAFFLMSGLLLIITIPFSLFIIYFPSILNVPSGHEFESQMVLLMMGITIFSGLISAPLSIGIYATQRFDLLNIAKIIIQFTKTILIVVLFLYIEGNVLYFSGATMLASIFEGIINIALSKRLVRNIHFSIKLFDNSIRNKIFSYGSWVFIIQVTSLLFINTDYIIINKFLGSNYVTDYSLVARWVEMISSLAVTAVQVITPVATELDANDDHSTLRDLATTSVRLIVILLIPPCLLIGVFGEELLQTWVGGEYTHLGNVLRVWLFPLVFILSAVPSTTILNGLGKVKAIGLINLLSAIINLSCSIFVVTHTSLGIYGVSLISSMALLFKNMIFIPLFLSKTINLNLSFYFKQFYRSFILSLLLLLLSYYIKFNYNIVGWLPLLSASLFCTILYLFCTYCYALTPTDRKRMKNIFGFSVSK